MLLQKAVGQMLDAAEEGLKAELVRSGRVLVVVQYCR